jgi:hypothetical protein
MGRMYRIVAEGISLGQTDTGDLLEIQGANGQLAVVHGLRVTQRDQELAQQFRLRTVRRSAPPLGTPVTVTPTPQLPGDAPASVTVFAGLIPTADVGPESALLDSDNQSLPNGFVYIPTPETRTTIIGSGSILALHVPDAHGQTGNVVFDVVVDLEEIG